MKILTLIAISFITLNTFAAEISCTTRSYTHDLEKNNPKITWCGAIKVETYDNGIKYRRLPKKCKNFQVDFFSIKSNDETRFTQYCKSIQSNSCYMVQIKDKGNRGKMKALTSRMLVRDLDDLPRRFTLSASGLGSRTLKAGVLHIMDLHCVVN